MSATLEDYKRRLDELTDAIVQKLRAGESLEVIEELKRQKRELNEQFVAAIVALEKKDNLLKG